jgi:formylglycine-generating enzyme required for sulfatase activity
MPLNTGKILNNRYRIVKLLGQGGFGAVYRAWDINFEMPCALKENTESSPEARRQFMREAQILRNLRHPNLPLVVDTFTLPGEGQYLVMDYVEGEDLQTLLNRNGGPLPEGQVLGWMRQVCDALTYLHSQNPQVIHRDIKPANIKITPEGKAILVDFGIAKANDPKAATTMGARAVTPGFSPNEQYGQGRTDERSDIYALGATLYNMLTGVVPIESVQRTTGAVLPTPRSLNPAITPNTEQAILKALEVISTQRWQSAAELKAALEPALITSAPSLQISPAVSDATMPLEPVSVPRPPVSVPRQPASVPRQPTRRRSLTWVWLLGGLALLALLSIGGIFLASNASRRATQTALAVIEPSRTPRPSVILTDTPAPPTATDTPLPTITETPPPPTATLTPTTVPTTLSSIDGMPLLFVPAGEFLMGATDSDPEAYPNEKPQHTVFLDSYWIDRNEVTNALYKKCVQVGVCPQPFDTRFYFNSKYANYPVIFVSWDNANTYCTWAGRKLPTEAQWEKAARGTDGRTYPWGEGLSCDKANYTKCVGDAVEVGSYPLGASPYGALDMAGNVWEWVADWYSETYYSVSPPSNPQNTEDTHFRPLRGGSFYNDPRDMRVASRSRVDNNYHDGTIGFRCAR